MQCNQDANDPTFYEAAELANLYHLARTALSGKDDSKYQRRLWVSKEYNRKYPDVSENRAYKMLDRALASVPIDQEPFPSS